MTIHFRWIHAKVEVKFACIKKTLRLINFNNLEWRFRIGLREIVSDFTVL